MKKKFFSFFFNFFIEKCGHFFVHFDGPQKLLDNDVQVLSFRSVEKKYKAKNRKKNYFFLEKIAFFFPLFAEKMMFY